MSKTIRRSKEKARNKSGSSHFIKDFVTIRSDSWEGCKGTVEAWGGQPLILKSGRRYIKAVYRYHSDGRKLHFWSNPQYGKKLSHIKNRIQYKNKISNYLKNNNYEIIQHKLYCLSWERD